MSMQRYGRVDKDGNLQVSKVDVAYLKEREITREIAEAKPPPNMKPIQFAPIPRFDQESEAVYQAGAVDRKDYIEVGVEVREVKQEDGFDDGFDDEIKDPVARK